MPADPVDPAPADPSPVPLDQRDLPGTADDTAPGDALSENLRAVRDAPSSPGGSDIAADDGGSSAMAQKLGTTTRKG